MIGAIIGDVVGSRFEFSNRLSKEFVLLTEENCFTDDTVMTCAVAQALMESREDYSDLPEKTVEVMQRIGRQYPACGYGGRFFRWMFTTDPKPYNSCGNGSAMRISAVGFAAKDVEEAKRLTYAVTAVSHDHPEGLKGAEATAIAIVMARKGCTKDQIIGEMKKYYKLDTSLAEYRRTCCGHGDEICQVTMPQALRCFMEGHDYIDVIRNCISIGGDSDTIAAIAGGIAEAYYGVPEELKLTVRQYLTPELWNIVREFEAWLGKREKKSRGRIPHGTERNGSDQSAERTSRKVSSNGGNQRGNSGSDLLR